MRYFLVKFIAKSYLDLAQLIATLTLPDNVIGTLYAVMRWR